MKITVSEREGAVIIVPEGNIDINASEFVEAVGWSVANKSKDILCNFAGINLVDYVGISLIAVAYKNVLNHGGKMKLYNLPGHVVRLFSVVGLDRVLEYYNSEDEAFSSLREDKESPGSLKKKLRRKFKRLEIDSVIEYKLKFSSQDFFKGNIINLSAIGVFMIGTKVFPAGDLLSIRMHFAHKPPVIDAEAKVVWVTDESIQPL